VYYYLHLADTLKYIYSIYLYVLSKKNVLQKEKAHEDSTKAAKTPSMIYYAKLNYNIVWMHQWQDERQWTVNDSWSCIIGNLHSDRLRPFINVVLPSFSGTRESHMLPAPF